MVIELKTLLVVHGILLTILSTSHISGIGFPRDFRQSDILNPHFFNDVHLPQFPVFHEVGDVYEFDYYHEFESDSHGIVSLKQNHSAGTELHYFAVADQKPTCLDVSVNGHIYMGLYGRLEFSPSDWSIFSLYVYEFSESSQSIFSESLSPILLNSIVVTVVFASIAAIGIVLILKTKIGR